MFYQCIPVRLLLVYGLSFNALTNCGIPPSRMLFARFALDPEIQSFPFTNLAVCIWLFWFMLRFLHMRTQSKFSMLPVLPLCFYAVIGSRNILSRIVWDHVLYVHLELFRYEHLFQAAMILFARVQALISLAIFTTY